MAALALDDSIGADIPAATRAVIGSGAFEKLAPAIYAQIAVVFADAFLTVDTDRGPKKMI